MDERTMKDERATWRRPKEGAIVSGVALVLARASGFRPGVVRALLVGACLLGTALAVAFAFFDHALLGRVAEPGLRYALIGVGLFLALLYPLLALVLPTEERPRRWDFGSACGGLLLLAGIGQALGVLLSPYWHAAKSAYVHGDKLWLLSWIGAYRAEHGLGAKEAILALFFLSALGFVLVERRAVAAFFRSMQVGVTTVALVTLAVTVGVLVPQIDGFEDPDQRVDLAREEADFRLFLERGYQKLPAELQDGNEQYEAFRWAEGYFIYHLLHLYGMGMPQRALTSSMEEGLERYGKKYGAEESSNRKKQMTAMFSGQEKVREIGAFIQRHEHEFWRFFQVSTALDLNRTYKSNWFATILWCLGVSVFLSAYKNWRLERARLPHGVWWAAGWLGYASFLKVLGAIELPWNEFLPLACGFGAAFFLLGAGVPKSTLSLQKLGFFVVHNGILVMLLGGFTSKLFTDRGILNLFLGEAPQATYFRHYDTRKRAQMPFSVRLDRFARKEWKALKVYFDEDLTSEPPAYTLWEGKTIELDHVEEDGQVRPRMRIHVDRLYDRVEVGAPRVSEAGSDAAPYPLAEVWIGGDERGRHYMSPLVGQTQTYRHEIQRDPGDAYRLAGAHGDDPMAHFPAPNAQIGLLEVTVVGAGDGAPRTYAVHLDEELEVEGGYKVRIAAATTDFHTHDEGPDPSAAPLDEQPRGRAAIWVDIVPPDGGQGGQTERRVVLEEFDAVQTGQQDTYFHSRVLLGFAWDDWSAPGPPRYLLTWRPDGKPLLVSEAGETLPVEIGKPLALPGGERVVPQGFFERAEVKSNLRFIEPDREAAWDSDFYAQGPRGAELTVTLEPGTDQEVSYPVRLASEEFARSNLWVSPDGRAVLYFFENIEGFPFEWRSVLSILEPDAQEVPLPVDLGTEPEREIRVNDYLYYRGYRFFQSNADPREPTYSGIGVVYDPGIPLVLLGMYTIIAGTGVAFLLRPVVLRKRSEVQA